MGKILVDKFLIEIVAGVHETCLPARALVQVRDGFVGPTEDEAGSQTVSKNFQDHYKI